MARFCKYCYDTKQTDIKPEGFLYEYYFENEQDIICPVCDHEVISSNISDYELKDLMNISQNPVFIKSMDDLKRDNIIEFESRMIQFRQSQPSQEDENTIRCPKCGSTSITTGARGVNNFWGLLGASKTVNRCGNCGYTWKPNGR